MSNEECCTYVPNLAIERFYGHVSGQESVLWIMICSFENEKRRQPITTQWLLERCESGTTKKDLVRMIDKMVNLDLLFIEKRDPYLFRIPKFFIPPNDPIEA